MSVSTARFWVWHKGAWVKLSLRPNQSLSTGSYRETDEGFTSEMTTWTYDAGRLPHESLIRQEYSVRSRDCDGLTEFDSEMVCRLDWLKYADLSEDGTPENKGIAIPNWENGKTRCRDHAAEAMGY